MTTTSAPTSPVAQQVNDGAGVAAQLRKLGITGTVVAVILSAAGWLLVRSSDTNGSIAAAVGVLLMTLPVALARRWPVPAVAIVAAAAILNGLVFGDIVRCGAAVPALLYITFNVGSRSRISNDGWGRSLLGLMLAFVSIGAQRIWDPALDNGFLALAAVVVPVVWAGGLGWAAYRRRSAAVAADVSAPPQAA